MTLMMLMMLMLMISIQNYFDADDDDFKLCCDVGAHRWYFNNEPTYECYIPPHIHVSLL